MNKTPKSKAENLNSECKKHHWRNAFPGDNGCPYCYEPIDIISRMEAMQQRFGCLQLEDRKPSCWDRVMSDPNRKDRYDDALLEAHMEAQRQNEGEDE